MAQALARWTAAVPCGGRLAHHNDTPTMTKTKNQIRNQLRLCDVRHHHRRGVALSAVVRDPEGGGSGATADTQRREEQQEEEQEVEGEEDTGGDIEIPEKPGHIRKVDGFLQGTSAEDLRAVFDGHHADPRKVHEYRFVWDYWHVPGQYTLLRTPAADYFPKEQYDQLVGAQKKTYTFANALATLLLNL
jgi:hypothetical protein